MRGYFKKEFVIICILIFVVGFFHYKLKEKPEEKEIESFSRFLETSSFWLNKTAPNFELKLLNGENFTVADNVGKKVIVLNFFATWCEPCKEEIPSLNKFYEKYKDNIIMVGIADDESEERIKQFVKENEIKYPVGIDTNERIISKYDVMSFPTTVVIGVNGKIQLYEIGAIYNTEVSLAPLINPNLELLKAGKGINKENYLREEKLTRKTGISREDMELTEREKNIAKKIYCPRGCGRNLLDCNCAMCKKAIEEIKEEIKKGNPDEEIIKKINKKYCEIK